MPTAIVTGATGILGRAVVDELTKLPKLWTTIYALSRSQKEDYPSQVKHTHIDLLSTADDMTKNLSNIEADYVFFCAYLEGKDEQENWDLNGSMLENFLSALEKTGITKNIKRVILTTGAKQYGVHLGVPKNPLQESDPWVESTSDEPDPSRPPNFYYRQQRILKDRAANSCWDWVVTYPNDVIGYARGNFMNLGTAIGLFASVQRELGEPLDWPGSETFYTRFDCFTSAKLHAQFCAWAALEPKAGNEAFNVVNGDAESYQNLWPKLAAYFGLRLLPDQLSQEAPGGKVVELVERPPIQEQAANIGLQGRVERSRLEMRIDLTEWSKRDHVRAAWDRLAEREALEKEAFEKATWFFLNFVLGRNYDIVISMSKARKLGWTGYVDTWDSFIDTFQDLEKAKILPTSQSGERALGGGREDFLKLQ